MANEDEFGEAIHVMRIEFLRSQEFDRLTHEQRLERWDQMVTALHDKMIPLVLCKEIRKAVPWQNP